jgi:hypothetical protein
LEVLSATKNTPGTALLFTDKSTSETTKEESASTIPIPAFPSPMDPPFRVASLPCSNEATFALFPQIQSKKSTLAEIPFIVGLMKFIKFRLSNKTRELSTKESYNRPVSKSHPSSINHYRS